MADINYQYIEDIPFRKSSPAVFTDEEYIYHVGGTSQGSQTLSGYSYKWSEEEGWSVLSASGPVALPRGIYYNGYYWLTGNGVWATSTPDSVYRSTDCINWEYVGLLPGATYGGYAVRLYWNYAWCIHNNRVYFTGYNNGVSYNNGSNAVVSTSDFVTFTIHRYHDQPDGLGYPKRSNCGFYSIDGILYVLGGEAETGSINKLTDHWRSLDDGATWEIIDTDFDNNVLINSILAVNGTGGGQCTNQQSIDGQFYIHGSTSFYTSDGVTFNQLDTSAFPTTGNVYKVIKYNFRFYIVGWSRNSSPYAYDDFYRSSETFYPDDSYVSFEMSTFHSPSPAYIRLTDTSYISSLTTDNYLRIWGLTNDRTSATTYYETSASYLDVSVEGIYGTTFSISLSAVF
jgi:hypothetical protein